MTGVLFFINVPQKFHEVLLRNDSSIFHRNITGRSKDDLHFPISKPDPKKGLCESKSEITLNIAEVESSKSYLKTSWEEIKQVVKKRNKLKITRPVRSVDVFADFHWDTPLETILTEVVHRLDVKNATWCATKNNKFWQVTFTLESGGLCEEALQVLRGFGIGTRHQSSLSIVPCTLFYGSSEHLLQEEYEKYVSSTTTPWSRFSSSVRARTNLAQVLLAVKADAAVTFDWCFLLLVAALVAGIGLVENSTVVIVASMLISPLMGPITACTLGTAVHDRSLQMIGVTHELLGLFMCLVIGFILGIGICILDGQYSIMSDWPTSEMMSRCEYRSLWVGMMIAIPSGAGVALAVLGDYTASLVGVAISASLLPPAVNAGLFWAMSLYRLVSPNDITWRVGQPSELAVLGTRSLCLTLVNILCIFLAGVTVYKVKRVCPLEQRDITWWSANKSRMQTSKKEHSATAWEIYSKWSNEEPKLPQGDNVQMDESYQPLDSETTSESQISENSSKRSSSLKRKTDSPDLCFYNLGYENRVSQVELPTLKPSLSFTVKEKPNGILT